MRDNPIVPPSGGADETGGTDDTGGCGRPITDSTSTVRGAVTRYRAKVLKIDPDVGEKPMTLVVSDEAVALLNDKSPEGDLARWFVEHAARYGRKAGISVSVSAGNLARLTGPGMHLRSILRSSLAPGSGPASDGATTGGPSHACR